MTTLNLLKGRLRTDFARGTTLDTVIADAINDAITHYQPTRFYFNETKDCRCLLVNGQWEYTDTDFSLGSVPITQMYKIDLVEILDGNTVLDLEVREYEEVDYYARSSSPSTGAPYWYARFNDGLSVYPIPDSVPRTLRIMGYYKLAGPASDSEANNKWMTEAFELLRCKAKSLIYTHHYKDPNKAKLMMTDETFALSRILGVANVKRRRGLYVPSF